MPNKMIFTRKWCANHPVGGLNTQCWMIRDGKVEAGYKSRRFWFFTLVLNNLVLGNIKVVQQEPFGRLFFPTFVKYFVPVSPGVTWPMFKTRQPLKRTASPTQNGHRRMDISIHSMLVKINRIQREQSWSRKCPMKCFIFQMKNVSKHSASLPFKRHFVKFHTSPIGCVMIGLQSAYEISLIFKTGT